MLIDIPSCSFFFTYSQTATLRIRATKYTVYWAYQKKNGLRADYGKSICDVYAETAKFLIEAYGNLDVLRACVYPGSMENLPSWAPN